MSSELERGLEGMFAEAPEPDPGAGEEALHRALHALRPVVVPRRGLRAAVLAFGAAVVLLVIAAGSLAAAGALHVSFGAQATPRPAAVPLTLPPGANGIVAIVDGRLSMVTKGGFRLHGLPVSAAALSPHALYVAAGIGDSLVAMAPDGRRAWSHPAGGEVVAIAWAPDGFRIAYVVHAGHRFVLHVVYGNGIHDTTIDRSVRAVRPSWRADSLAFAYVGAGGSPVVYDLTHQSRSVVRSASSVTQLAFAPAGKALAVGTPDGVLVVTGGRRRTVARRSVDAFGWLDGRVTIAMPGPASALLRTFARDGAPLATFRVPRMVVGFTGDYVVTRTRGRILAERGGEAPVTVLGVRRATTVRELEIG